MATYQYNDTTYTLPELRTLFPHVSLPAVPGAEDLEPLGVTLLPDAQPDAAEELAVARADKLALLEQRFEALETGGHFASSLGFEMDATQRTSRDIQGLATLMEATGRAEGLVCDYQCRTHQVTLDQVKTLHLEILLYGQMAYARKWELRAAIEAAQTTDELAGIEIEFDTLPAPVLGQPVPA